MIDIVHISNYPFGRNETILKVKYRFRAMLYLVADRHGNFFNLAHCPNSRTIQFKQLDKSNGYVYYHGNKIRMSTLYNRVYEVAEDVNIVNDM